MIGVGEINSHEFEIVENELCGSELYVRLSLRMMLVIASEVDTDVYRGNQTAATLTEEGFLRFFMMSQTCLIVPIEMPNKEIFAIQHRSSLIVDPPIAA